MHHAHDAHSHQADLFDPRAFDAKAKDWDANPMHARRTEAIADAMRRLIPLSRDMRALEVGCGTGLLSFALREELGPITLTDTSPAMLEVVHAKIAQTGATTMTPRLLDLATETLPAGSFELIYLQMALHHIPDVDHILTTFSRLLVPGGYLAVADLEAEDGSFHGEGFTGHHGFEPAALARRVAAAGFAAPIAETVFEIQREGHMRPFPVFLLVAKKA